MGRWRWVWSRVSCPAALQRRWPMGSVTPIAAGSSEPPGGTKAPRHRRPHPAKVQKLLDDTRDRDGFSTLDVINGLRGVCCALDQAAATESCREVDLVCDLSMAAQVLSSMLGDRVE